jgi:hypothetical protein
LLSVKAEGADFDGRRTGIERNKLLVHARPLPCSGLMRNKIGDCFGLAICPAQNVRLIPARPIGARPAAQMRDQDTLKLSVTTL